MILRILTFLFQQVRELESALNIVGRNNNQLKEITDGHIQKLGQDVAHWRARYDAAQESIDYLRTKLEKAEALTAEIDRELKDILKTAGDSLGLRVTGRRLFSMAPVEAPPAEAVSSNISAGSSRQFAGDVARRPASG